ncbi:NAD(P)H azoreductase [Alphaproteobacteria bacterium SO-S41]|nr:NAD(P)H azoreductase [Alphaproteobacteria bacterium SO-S41]
MTVLVTGATGKTGRSLVPLLQQNGIPHRAASRSGAAPFDWTDPATWDAALEGVTAIYLIAPGNVPDPYARMIAFCERAQAKGVTRFVLLSMSSLPAGPWGHGLVHQWLIDHAVDWAVLRPTAFMQNFSEGPFLASIRDENTIYSNTGNGRVAFIDAADIAACAYAALTAPAPLNRDFTLTGSERLSYDDVAATLTRATGRTITHTHISTEAMAARFVQRGLPELTAQFLAAGYATIATGAEDRSTADVQTLTGQAPTTFAAFATAHAGAWRRA